MFKQFVKHLKIYFTLIFQLEKKSGEYQNLFNFARTISLPANDERLSTKLLIQT